MLGIDIKRMGRRLTAERDIAQNRWMRPGYRTLVRHEAVAERLTALVKNIPGLLQTRPFAERIDRLPLFGAEDATSEQSHRQVAMRLRRQRILDRLGSDRATFILTEDTVDMRAMERIGHAVGTSAMADQMQYLAHLNEQGLVTVRILPVPVGKDNGTAWTQEGQNLTRLELPRAWGSRRSVMHIASPTGERIIKPGDEDYAGLSQDIDTAEATGYGPRESSQYLRDMGRTFLAMG